MKALTPIIAFALGIAAAAVACRLLDSAREGRRQAQLLSDVYDPMRQCLEDIMRTYDHGDAALAERKTRVLQQRWSEFLKGGAPPEQFSHEIIEVGPSATRPAP